MRSTPIYWFDHDGNVTDQRGHEGIPCIKLRVGRASETVTLAESIELYALVDTGADVCQFTSDVYRTLQCESTVEKEVHGNYGSVTLREFEMSLMMEGTQTNIIGPCSEFRMGQKVPFDGIIGRTLLQFGRLILDNADGTSEVIWHSGPFQHR